MDFERQLDFKAKARLIYRKAVNKGLLKPLPCQICGDNKTEGHHEDYSQPLEVMWLCLKHHRERHREIRQNLVTFTFRVKRHQLHHLKFICRQNNWIFSEVVRYGIMLALKEIKKDLSDRCPLT